MKSSIFFFLIGVYVTSLQGDLLKFSTAYKLALENAHSLKSSIFQVEGQKERLVQEESQLYPQINISGYYKKSEFSYYDKKRNDLNQGLFNYEVKLKQSIYNASIYSRIGVESSKQELYKIQVELEKEKLAQTVFQSYLEVLKANNQINLYKSYLEYSQSRLDELKIKYKMFLVTKMDLLEMEVEYKSTKISLIREKKLLKVYKLKLEKLIGTKKYKLPVINSDKHLLLSIKEMKESVLNKNDFAYNLELLQAKLQLEIAKKEVDSSSSAHYPTLDLEGSYSGYDTDNASIDAPYKDVQSIMLYVNIPIYTGGYTSSKVREKRLMQQSTNEKLFEVKKDVTVLYNEYSAIFEASIDSVSVYKEAYDASLLHVKSIEEGYKHGLKSIIDLNDAKTKQYEVRYKYIENIYEMVDMYIGLLIIVNDFENIDLLDSMVRS